MNESKLLAFLTCLLTDDKEQFFKAYEIGTRAGYKRRGRKPEENAQYWRQVNGISNYIYKKQKGAKK